MKKHKNEKFIVWKRLLQYVPLILLGILLVILLYYTVTCLLSCIFVIRYTIPAGALEPDNPTVIGYLFQIGLFRHLSEMPSSAKDYFARYAVAFTAHAALTVIILLMSLKAIKKYKDRFPSEYEVCDELICDDDPLDHFHQVQNKFALSALAAAAKGTGRPLYNPLFFYSESEAGNAAFFEMIKDAFRSNNSSRGIICAKCEDFLICGSKKPHGKSFDYASLTNTVIIVDDLHGLIDRKDLQSEIVDSLVKICGAGNQLVLLSACTPHQLAELTNGIVRNFESALLVNLSL